MNIDELQSARDRERSSDRLQQLRDSFYADAGEYIRQLRRERDRTADRVDDPFDAPEVSRLSDEIDAAEGTVEAIFEKRLGKIVDAASLAAAGMPADSEGMTAEEKQLFDALVTDIEQSRERVLAALDGTSDGIEAASEPETEPGADNAPPGPVRDADPAPDSDRPTDVSAADLMSEAAPGDGPDGTEGAEPEHEPPVSDGGAVGVTRTTVRVTADVGAIFGVDEREYDLAVGDVVTLPSDNADLLVESDAATPLE
ncbi:MAG: hypothetical protein ABEH56_05065 [Salinirussus sp.]